MFGGGDDADVLLEFFFEELLLFHLGEVKHMIGSEIHQFKDEAGVEFKVVVVPFDHVGKVACESPQRRSLVIVLPFRLFLLGLAIFVVLFPSHLMRQGLRLDLLVAAQWFGSAHVQLFNCELMSEGHLKGSAVVMDHKISVFLDSL